MSHTNKLHFENNCVEIVDVPTDESSQGKPDLDSDCILIDTIHCGDFIPLEFANQLAQKPYEVSRDDLEAVYVQEKDWGADELAFRLAQKLGVNRMLRVNVARALLDFGRFPGVTLDPSDHLGKLAIGPPFSKLGNEFKRRILEEYYDPISDQFDDQIKSRFRDNKRILKFAIHTYDRYNVHADGTLGTERPALSLLFTPREYQTNARLPQLVFDPLFPSELAESTAHPALIATMTLELIKNEYGVSSNLPYLLPLGSVEMRFQVWAFLNFLLDEFRKRSGFSVAEDDIAFQRVEEMLLDTNRRHSATVELATVIHSQRRIDQSQPDAEELRQALRWYEEIQAFFTIQFDDIMQAYRKKRPTSLVIEIRKDLIWNGDESVRTEQTPNGIPIDTAIEDIASALANGIQTFMTDDKINLEWG